MGYAINTENNATELQERRHPAPRRGGAADRAARVRIREFGAEAWYFQQVTCDSGAGATLGCFKGRTAGIGPVLGYIQPIGKRSCSSS